MTRNSIHPPVHYNYRYFLPHAPLWGSREHSRQRLRELLAFGRESRLDAVQFFVNTLPGTYYMPAHNAAEQREWAAWMQTEVAPAVRRAGLSYQLNFQMLLGAGSYGLDMRDEYDWGFLVNQYGHETLGCACPLCPRFRRAMGAMLRLWAATQPDVIWIDDDFRMHNHGRAEHGLDFYCYCSRHLAAFARRVGRHWPRPALVREVLRPGPPSRLRQQWLDFLGDSMVATAAWMRREVQRVSPRTRLALMTSVPDVHAAEGRDWKRTLRALSGRFRPLIRPCSGCYTGTTEPVKSQTVTYRFFAQSLQTIEQTLGADRAEYGPELENTRFTTWCKSSANTEYVLMLAQLLGCPQITLSLHDLEGSPLADEPTLAPLLRTAKPWLQAVANLDLRAWRPAGVVLINDPASARKVQVAKHAHLQSLGLMRDWDDVLLEMGIPAYYAAPAVAAGGREVVALERYTAWCLTDRELRRVLSQAVLLDGGAAEVLQARGFGRFLGVHVSPPASFGIMSEQYEADVLPDVAAGRAPHRGQAWHPVRATGATVASRFIDPKNRWHTGSTVFENSLGGRVAVYASVGMFAHGSFGCHARRRWLHGVLRWLSRERFSVLPVIPHHGLTVVRTRGARQLVAFANLGTDKLTHLQLRLGDGTVIRQAQCLDRQGRWTRVPVKMADHQLRVPCRLNVFDWLVLLLD